MFYYLKRVSPTSLAFGVTSFINGIRWFWLEELAKLATS